MKLAITLLFVTASIARAGTLHVASGGSDTNDGSAARPFATLERARDVGRTARKPLSVIVHGGTYEQTKTLELTAADSQTTWQAAGNGDVRITGGPTLAADAFQPVTDEKVLARLHERARSRVMQADVATLQLGEYPEKFRGVPAAPELFFNDHRMTLARWPNEGWATVAKIIEAGSVPRYGDESNRPGVFEYDGEAP